MDRSKSAALFAANRRSIPGGLVSLNRKVEPEIAFVRGQGRYVWDADGNRYSIITPPSPRTCSATPIPRWTPPSAGRSTKAGP